jgi:hypothetical protein
LLDRHLAIVERFDADFLGQMDQFGHGRHAHLFHDAGTVYLDGLLADTKLVGNLLIEQSHDHQPEHYIYPWCEGLDALLDLGLLVEQLHRRAILLDGLLHGVQ